MKWLSHFSLKSYMGFALHWIDSFIYSCVHVSTAGSTFNILNLVHGSLTPAKNDWKLTRRKIQPAFVGLEIRIKWCSHAFIFNYWNSMRRATENDLITAWCWKWRLSRCLNTTSSLNRLSWFHQKSKFGAMWNHRNLFQSGGHVTAIHFELLPPDLEEKNGFVTIVSNLDLFYG